jgi:hypothetical protein
MYNSLSILEKGITLSNPNLNVGDVFFINNKIIYFKNLYVNANIPYSDIPNEYIDIYGGLGIVGNLFLDGKLNIKPEFNIDYNRKYAPLELKNLLVHIGNSEIYGFTTILNDFNIGGDMINRKDLHILNDILQDEYYIGKNLYGNIFTVTNNLMTYNNIISNNVTGINANVTTNVLIGNVTTNNLWSHTVKYNTLTPITTEINEVNNCGNLTLTGLVVNNIETLNKDHGTINCNNLISNGLFILEDDLYTNILNTPSITAYKNIISNIIDIKEDIYVENIRFNYLISTFDPTQREIEAGNVYAANLVNTQEIFSESAIFDGDVYINGRINYISADILSIADTILTLNKPAIGLGQYRDAGIFHIYNNEPDVPALLYKVDPSTNNQSPIKGRSDIIVFGNVSIQDFYEIYFNNADVIGLHSVYMNSINGNIFDNFIIGENTYNTYLGNTHLYSNTFIENLSSSNIHIQSSFFVPNLITNIYGNTFNLSQIKPYINNNLIINQLIINNIYPTNIEGNDFTTSIFQANILNIVSGSNINANILTNSNVQANILTTNNITATNINIDGNLSISSNVITKELFVQDKLSPTILISSNTTIANHQNIIFQNKNNSIFATLNNTYINDTKNFVLDEINGYPCYVITNNGTYYLNNSYSYLILHYDGTKWFSLDSTPITSKFNSKFTGDINSNIGKSIAMNYYGNIICAGGPDSDYGIVKYLQNTGSNWSELNLTSNTPFNKFGNPLSMSGDGQIFVVGCENAGNVFVYKDLSQVQDIPLKYKPKSIGVSYDGNVIAFGLNSVLGNIGCLQIYKFNGTKWIYKDSILPENHIGSSSIGDSIDMSINGDVIVFGGSKDNGNIGKVWIYNEIPTSNVYINYNNNNSVKTFLFDNQNGNLYVGGSFTSLNNINTIGGGLIDTTSNTVIKFGNVNGNVNSITKYEGNIYYAGNFTMIDGIVANSIARWDGYSWNQLGNGISGTINTIAIGNGNVYVGGSFDYIDSVLCNNVAVWNINTSTWNNIGGINGEVKNILYHNQTVYIGGNFSSVNITGIPISANNIASYNIDLNQWNRIQNGVNGNVEKIYQYKDEIYVAGTFTKYGDYNGNFGKIVNNVWENSLLELSGPIYEIFGYDNYLLLGGDFSAKTTTMTINITGNITYTISYGINANNIIKYYIDNKNTEPLPFDINGTVRNIYYDDVMSRYYIGGNNLLYYHSGLSYKYEQNIVSNNYIGSSFQGSYIKYKDYELLIGSKESNAFWRWTKYGDYWNEEVYNKNSYKVTNFAASDNMKNIFTNSGNIVIQNQNIGNDYYDDYNIMLPESGNINGIACNYNSSKLVAGINSNLYIYY